MTQNSDMATPAGTLPDIPVAFSATEGTMAPPSGTVTAGMAASVFTSTTVNNGTASADVDNQQVCAPITVTPAVCPEVSMPVTTSYTSYPDSMNGVPVNLPVTTTDLTGYGVISADFTFNYDPAVLSPAPADITVTAGGLSGSPQILVNKTTAGSVVVSYLDTGGISGAGTLVTIGMKVIGPQLSSTPLTLTGFKYNNTLVCSNVTNGTLTVVSGTVSGKVHTRTSRPERGDTTRYQTSTLMHREHQRSRGFRMIDGLYSLDGFGAGAYTVTPSKTPMDSMASNGIMVDDPGMIQMYVVGLMSLSAEQQEAAKVSGLGTISSYEAALVAQWIVGIPNPINQTGTWKFTPVSRTYSDVNADHPNEDYLALLMGDVSGDWTTGAMARPMRSVPTKETVVASIANTTAAAGTELTVPVRIDNLQGKSITAYQMDVRYDPAVIEPIANGADMTGTMSDGMSFAANSPEPGLLKVVVYGTAPISGEGVYVNLRFNVIGAIRQRYFA